MDLIFTDLDGTLLDRDTYSWAAAKPALELVARKGIPWMLVTSKTRAEVDYWRAKLGNHHPFVVENGGAVFIPSGYFGSAMSGQANRDSYDVIEWGTPYAQLAGCLHGAALSSGCRVRGFCEMTAETLAALCDLPLEQAVLAKQREYDEAFVALDPDKVEPLRIAVNDRGLRMVQGGRFWHILGANDKALAVDALIRHFSSLNGPVRTIGLGDGLNDAGFLELMDVPVLIRSPSVAQLREAVPRGIVTSLSGPAGWNEAVSRLIGAD